MKRFLNYYLSLTLIASLFVVAGCSEEDDPLINAPQISFDGVSGDGVTADVGEDVDFTVNVTAPGGFNRLVIYRTLGVDGTRSTLLDTARTSGDVPTAFTLPVSYTVTADEAGQDVYLDFRAVGEDDQEAERRFTITVNEPEFAEYQTVLLGGQTNTTEPSFYNAVDNERYMYAAANEVANRDQVDFLYHYGNTNFNIIASPDDTDSRAAWTGYGNPLTNLNNSTRFKRITTTSSGYANINSNNALINAYAENANPELSRLTQLQQGETFAFRLDADRGARYGVVEVVEVAGTSGTNRTITLNVKVQAANN